MRKVPYQVFFTETKLDELKELGKKEQLPVSVLVRMGAELVIEKYKELHAK